MTGTDSRHIHESPSLRQLKEFPSIARGSVINEKCQGEIIDNQLVVDLPEDLETAAQMKDIAILIGNRRITVKWKDDTIYPTAH
jgi:hypothetical protein